jgi:hypothetical protein
MFYKNMAVNNVKSKMQLRLAFARQGVSAGEKIWSYTELDI